MIHMNVQALFSINSSEPEVPYISPRFGAGPIAEYYTCHRLDGRLDFHITWRIKRDAGGAYSCKITCPLPCPAIGLPPRLRPAGLLRVPRQLVPRAGNRNAHRLALYLREC